MARVRVITVDSADDERLSGYRAVSEPALARDRGLFVAEGRRVVQRLLQSPSLEVESVLVTRPAYEALQGSAAALEGRPDLTVYLVSQAVMNGVTGFPIHRGCLALAVRPALPHWETLAVRGRTLVVLERLGDADNVGSAFRSAAAFGVDGVLLGPGCADPLYRKAIRTSMGAALTIPFARIDTPAQPWPVALRKLRDAGWHVMGLTPRADGRPLWETVRGGESARLALVFGHEGDGLSQQALDACTELARIPMVSGVDSLNVAVSVGVTLYDVTRSRHQATPTGSVPA
jgi:tRNA G18 (ribose-2'-O)-methylase SpoU